ncbi:MAG: hypothetical protein ACOY40_08630 [Bacillota bacterium]
MSKDFSLNIQPLSGKLKDLRPLKILLVNKTAWEPVWDYLVRTYHYLGNETMIGPRIKYLVFHEDRPLAALSYNRAALHVETFVDHQYRGTCYRAANWLYLGKTSGFARVGKTYIHHGQHKRVFVYLLNPAFPKLIAEDPCRHPDPQTVGKRFAQ